MKNKKRRFEIFSLYDHTGMERHLERMAKKGWLLEKITSFGWIYRSIEPQSLTFTVTYYPAASEFEPEPSEKQQTYWDFCRQDGWKLAAAAAQMQVFYSEQEEPRPIETDASLQLQNIHKTMKKAYLPVYLILLVLGLLQAIMFWGNLWEEPVWVLSSSTYLCNGIVFTLGLVLSAAEVLGYFCWYREAKGAAELDGSFLATRSHSRLQKVILFLILAVCLLWLLYLVTERERWAYLFGIGYMLSVLFAVNGIKALLKRKKAPAQLNRILTVVSSFMLAFVLLSGTLWLTLQGINRGWFEREPAATYEYRGETFRIYHDLLPLTIEDLTQTNYEGYSYEYTDRSSPLAAQIEARQRPRMDDTGKPDLEYTITTVKVPALYNLCRDGILREFTLYKSASQLGYHVVEGDPAIWSANQVYQYYSDGFPMDRYLVCYDGHMAEITFGWAPTEEQIRRAGAILKQVQ